MFINHSDQTANSNDASKSRLNTGTKTGVNFFGLKNSELNKNESKADMFNKTANSFRPNQNTKLAQKFSSKFVLDEENLDIINSNPLLYNLNFNPLRKQADEEMHDEEKLSYLKRIAYASKVRDSPGGKSKKMKGMKFLMALKGAKRRANASLNTPLDFFKNFANGDNEYEEEVKRGN